MIDRDLSIKLYQTITDSNKPRVFEKWHCSNMAECPRCMYFKRLGIAPVSKPSAAKILRWTAGHCMEEAIREHIQTIYPDVKSNQRLDSKEWDLTGEYDNLIGDTIIEIKSVHDMAFIERDGETYLKENKGTKTLSNGKVQNIWGIKDTPYLHHEIQNHAYVLLLREQNIEVKQIIYVYISLSGRIVVYRTDVQEELVNYVKNKLTMLNEAWKTQTPPHCICHDKNHQLYDSVMQWCDYRNGDECCSLNLIKE